jgi:hypothetical protein
VVAAPDICCPGTNLGRTTPSAWTQDLTTRGRWWQQGLVIAPFSAHLNALAYLSLWQDCGRNKQNTATAEWKQLSTDVKTLDFARGCISIQNQLVVFYASRVIHNPKVGSSIASSATNSINSFKAAGSCRCLAIPEVRALPQKSSKA